MGKSSLSKVMKTLCPVPKENDTAINETHTGHFVLITLSINRPDFPMHTYMNKTITQITQTVQIGKP